MIIPRPAVSAGLSKVATLHRILTFIRSPAAIVSAETQHEGGVEPSPQDCLYTALYEDDMRPFGGLT